MTEHNNPPAFPQPYLKCEKHMLGMTMLDHFAGLAMQALLARPNLVPELAKTHESRAEFAYNQAAAMLKERAKWIK